MLHVRRGSIAPLLPAFNPDTPDEKALDEARRRQRRFTPRRLLLLLLGATLLGALVALWGSFFQIVSQASLDAQALDANLLADAVELGVPPSVLQPLRPRLFTLGVPTVSRDGVPTAAFVAATVQSILLPDATADTDEARAVAAARAAKRRELVRVVVYNGDDAPRRDNYTRELVAAFTAAGMDDLVRDGAVVFAPPPDTLLRAALVHKAETQHDQWGDAPARIHWRSKENLDAAHMQAWSARLDAALARRYPEGAAAVARVRGSTDRYYIDLNDDVFAARDWLEDLLAWMDAYFPAMSARGRDDWLMLLLFTPFDLPDHTPFDPDALAGFAFLFRMRDVTRVASYTVQRYNESPLDWLVRDWIIAVQHGTEALDDGGERAQLYARTPSLFEHAGKVSSLKGKVQEAHALHFRDAELPPPAAYRRLGVGV